MYIKNLQTLNPNPELKRSSLKQNSKPSSLEQDAPSPCPTLYIKNLENLEALNLEKSGLIPL